MAFYEVQISGNARVDPHTMCPVSIAMIYFHQLRQSVHDLIAQTIVVKSRI